MDVPIIPNVVIRGIYRGIEKVLFLRGFGTVLPFGKTAPFCLTQILICV
jgi:hypothetical protein